MLPIYLAITSRSPEVGLADLVQVAAALQKQVTRDFAPLWRVDATVSAFPIAAIPAGYWPIIVDDDARPGPAAAADGSPYACINPGPTWSLAASHQALQMLADPFANRTIPAQSPHDSRERVQVLLEACAPCADPRFAYSVNGLPVSDFATPAYYDPTPSPQARHSFGGALLTPHQVAPGGHLTWLTPCHRIEQAVADQSGHVWVEDRGALADRGARSLRAHAGRLAAALSRDLSEALLPERLTHHATAAYAARGEQHRRLAAHLTPPARRVADLLEPAAPR